MIEIFCGEDTEKSRKAYSDKMQEYKKEYIDLHNISSSDISDIDKIIQGKNSLFSDKKVVCIENGLSQKKNREILKEYIGDSDIHILVWDSKADPRTIKSNFKKGTVNTYTFPTSIWKFLDGLYPGNSAQLLNILPTVLRSTHETMLLYLMQRRMKDLLLVLADKPGKRKLAGWQKNNMLKQARQWEPKNIQSMYAKMHEIEVGIKTGTIPYSTHEALDILITFYLQ